MISKGSNKGITLISLIITIIILLILSGTVIHNLNLSNQSERYNKMVADIELLEDKTLIYFNKYGEIPKTSRFIDINGVDYYEIDLLKLENLTLNYGKEDSKEDLSLSSDVYLMNSNLNIYYLKGIEYKGEIYHSEMDSRGLKFWIIGYMIWILCAN